MEKIKMIASNSKGEIICPLCRTENPWLIIGGCIYEAG